MSSTDRSAALTWALLATGVGVASVSGILIRYAEDAGPLAISFWRCAAGAALLLPFALSELREMKPKDYVMPAVAGAFLALHFATWITSLEMTTIAASVLLVSMTPVFTAGASRVLFGERIGARGWGGVALALAGTVLIVGTDLGGSSATGNLLALAGGAMAAGYVMAGSESRKTLGILPYAVVTYSISGVLLLPPVLIDGQSLGGYDDGTWLALAAIVIGPQLLGHTVINLVLKDIDATTVSVSIMAEPIIASALAYLLFSETPSALIYPGGAAILLGIYLASTISRPSLVVE
jgi:drug/metabolite transporter (DMT)-like permease